MRALAFALALLAALPATASDRCGDHRAMVEYLRERYAERLVASARASGDTVLEIYASADGATWTALFTRGGVACIGAVGTGWSAREVSGGGGGGTAIKWVTGLTPGSTVNVTVGGAGSSSFFGASGSPMCRATGGSSGGVVYTADGGVAGGAGGIGNVGDVLMRGQDGGCGIIAGSYASGGTGGSSSMGGGGGGGSPAFGASAAGTVGGAYGGGGGGGAKSAAAGSASGGGGASGLVLIEWIEA